MNKFTVCLLLCVLIYTNCGFAGDSDFAGKLAARIEGSAPANARITDAQFKAEDPNRLLAVLASFENHPDRAKRRIAHGYLARVAALHPTTSVRQEVVQRLVKSIYDRTDHQAYKLFKRFAAQDFNSETKDLILRALSDDRVSGRMIRLAGIANIKEALPRLEELSVKKPLDFNNVGKNMDLTPQQREGLVARLKQDYANRKPTDQWYYDKCWHAKLALARMGVKRDIVRCIELAESIEDPDERVRRLLPDIGYIRQSEAIEYVCKYLNSDGRLLSVARERYANCAMYILAESIEDYPVKRKLGGRYTDKEIELCRQWMADKANWKIIR